MIPRLLYQLAFAFRECEAVKTEARVGAGRGERMWSCPASVASPVVAAFFFYA